METMLIVIHVAVCIFLTLVVLLQQGNKQGMGSAFGGGGSSTVFGGRGANTFLQKLTAGAAGLFMVTSLSLSYLSSRTGSAMDAEPSLESPEQKINEGEKKDAPAPTTPATGAAPAPAEAPAAPAAADPAPAAPAPDKK